MITLAHLENRFGVQVLDYLDRQVAVPVIVKSGMQGDVSSLRVTTKPATTPLPAAGAVVVRGENGGNTHSLHGVGFWDVAPQTSGTLKLGTLTVPEGEEVFLLHPEHGGLQYSPGTYELGGQREYAGEWRQVAD
jgi:hypothetical protein